MSTFNKIVESLVLYADTKKDIQSLEKFFQVYSGGYGEGDKFIGVSVPIQRKISNQFFKEASLSDIQNLIARFMNID